MLQTNIAPNVFTPRGAYDGRKNMFTSQKWSFGDAAEVSAIFLFHCVRALNYVALVLCLSRDTIFRATASDRGSQGTQSLQGTLT